MTFISSSDVIQESKRLSSEDKNISLRSSRRIVFVMGLSGAGRSNTLKILEDLGYGTVDNLPLSLVSSFIEQQDSVQRSLALTFASHGGSFDLGTFNEVFDSLERRLGVECRLVFLECSDEVLLRRFRETRRCHPMGKYGHIAEGIRRERDFFDSFKQRANLIIDTSNLSSHDLRRVMTERFRLEQDTGLYFFVTSFAYRMGLPRESDLVFDVRFLKNPYWQQDLRMYAGTTQKIGSYIGNNPEYKTFFQHLKNLFQSVLSYYHHNSGKSYLTIAFGCSGGRHRSVYVAEQFTSWLQEKGYKVELHHRDLE